MGLLDDAIREHLELKRLRGADPGEVAREERAALAPVFTEEPPDAEGDGEVPGDGGEELHVPAGEELAPAGEAPIDAHPAAEQHYAEGTFEEQQSAHHAEVSSAGQETAEIDMSAVLDEGHQTAGGFATAEPVAAGPPQTAGAELEPEDTALEPEDTALDWEPPARDGGEVEEHPPEQVPGQERLSFE